MQDTLGNTGTCIDRTGFPRLMVAHGTTAGPHRQEVLNSMDVDGKTIQPRYAGHQDAGWINFKLAIPQPSRRSQTQYIVGRVGRLPWGRA